MAEPRLQASAYQLILERRVNNFILPDNVFIIAAGNRVCDNAISYGITSAISDRFIHFNIIPTLESWLKWVQEQSKKGNPMMPEVIAFLQARPDFLHGQYNDLFSNDNDDSAITSTPRKLVAA